MFSVGARELIWLCPHERVFGKCTGELQWDHQSISKASSWPRTGCSGWRPGQGPYVLGLMSGEEGHVFSYFLGEGLSLAGGKEVLV